MRQPQVATQLILFAKEPITGQVKTRLIPKLGKQGACQLYEQMLRLQLERFSRFPGCDFSLHISPDSHSDYAHKLKHKYAIDVQQQRGSDLGERMFLSLRNGLQKYQQVVLIGADCPFLDQQVMQTAIQTLNLAPLVFVPALDGGYMLVGARQIKHELFIDIDWSTERVMRQTRERIKLLGWQYKELSPLADIDEEADLALLKQTPINLPASL